MGDSMSAIVLSGDTSGTITLDAPAVAGTNTINLPAATGTLALTGAAVTRSQLPVGSVLQVVNSAFSTGISSSSSTLSDTGLTATITPTSATSKILVLVDLNGCGKDTGNTYMRTALLRGATNIAFLGVFEGYTGNSSSTFYGNISTNYLDSPATTSATTYKIQYSSVSNVATVYINTGQGGSLPTSTMTLLEIAA
jgi:hypothetical protein